MEKENGTTTITELAKEIAGHLPGWELGDHDSDRWGERPIIAHLAHDESGAKVGLKTAGAGSHAVTQNHRLEVFPCWPPGPKDSGWRVYSPHDPMARAITAAVRRGPKAIAGDIARRMPLSAFLAEYATEAERSERDADRMRRNKAFIEDVARFWDAGLYPGGLRTRKYGMESHESLDMEIQWGRAKLTIESEDLEMMDTLARLATMSGANLLDILIAAKVTLDRYTTAISTVPLNAIDFMSQEEAERLRILIGEVLK